MGTHVTPQEEIRKIADRLRDQFFNSHFGQWDGRHDLEASHCDKSINKNNLSANNSQLVLKVIKLYNANNYYNQTIGFMANMKHLLFYVLLTVFGTCGFSNWQFAMTLDGSLSEPEWKDAAKIVEFQQVMPYTGHTAEFATEVLIFSNQDGIYLGIQNYQAEQWHTKTISSRDSNTLADYNRVIIDFDSNGLVAYEFTITNGNSIQDAIWINGNSRSSDWDGIWSSASQAKTDRWITEILVPWNIVPMIPVDSAHRSIHLLVERYLFKQHRLFSSIGVTSSHPQYLSHFQSITVNNHSLSRLDSFVNLVGSSDSNSGRHQLEAGGDIFWKPTSNQQLSLTANPDFSQVESDTIVINFSPNETFFEEKRPFFTENQGAFSTVTPLEMDLQPKIELIHTRRIGAVPDAGTQERANILGAVKYSLKTSYTSFGAFSAVEEDYDDSKGKDFYAGRLAGKLDKHSIAGTFTHTERPELNRSAQVWGADGVFHLGDTSALSAAYFQSHIKNSDDTAAKLRQRGGGGFLSLLYAQSSSTHHGLQFMNLDPDVDLNDLGFLTRNNLRSLAYRVDKEVEYNKDHSVLSDELGGKITVRENYQKEQLPKHLKVYYNRKYQDTSGVSTSLQHQTEGLDDRVTRGYSSVIQPEWWYLLGEYYSSQSVSLRHKAGIWYSYGGYDSKSIWLSWQSSYYFNDYTNITSSVQYLQNSDWITWSHINNSSQAILSSYDKEETTLRFHLNHNFLVGQELRLNFQWVGVAAKYIDSFVVKEKQLASYEDELSSDFSRSKIGIQIRYTYHLANSSLLYVVYSRGGVDSCDECQLDTYSNFKQSLHSHDANQFYVKLRYAL